IQDTIAKMFGLQSKRLHELHLRQKNIAGTIVKLLSGLVEIHVLSKNCPFVDSLIVNRNLTLGDIVVDDHLARPNHDHFANLLWIEPAHMDAGYNFGWIL